MPEYNSSPVPMRLTGVVEDSSRHVFEQTRQKGKVLKKGWTEDEEAELIELSQTHSFQEIAELMDRSKDSVANRYAKLSKAGKAPRKPTVFTDGRVSKDMKRLGVERRDGPNKGGT